MTRGTFVKDIDLLAAVTIVLPSSVVPDTKWDAELHVLPDALRYCAVCQTAPRIHRTSNTLQGQIRFMWNGS